MNLIICCTPLQVLIAEQIIQRYPREKFFALMLYEEHRKTEKYQHYFCRLKRACTSGGILIVRGCDYSSKKKKIEWSHYWALLRIGLASKGRFKRVFLANSEILFIWQVLRRVYFQEIYTFDDGTRNIISPELDQWIYAIEKPERYALGKVPILTPLQWITEKEILDRSKAHYTIFPGIKNIVEPTIPISLIHHIPSRANDEEPINILLGQPLYDADNEKNTQIVFNTLSQFNIDYYFPHPREIFQLIIPEGKNCQIIKTPLIFEDYYLQHWAGRPCRIYSYCSTAALNLLAVPNLEITSLRPHSILDNHIFVLSYELMAKFGIPIIDCDF